VKVVQKVCSLDSLASAERLLADARIVGSVGGIFHLPPSATAAADDCVFSAQTNANFKGLATTHYLSTRYLDEATRGCGTGAEMLKWFVVFVSVTAAGRGRVGLSATAWAQSVIERIVERRRADCYPAVAVELGPVDTAEQTQAELVSITLSFKFSRSEYYILI
jgi:fatty acid synthase